jgi:hypothetical protein
MSHSSANRSFKTGSVDAEKDSISPGRKPCAMIPVNCHHSTPGASAYK